MHTQMSQYAIGFGFDWQSRLRAMPTKEVFLLAKENFKRDVSWCGFAEYFEESIFVFAKICGLSKVPKWEKDTRNKWRVPLESIGESGKLILEDQFAYEIEFYNWALELFKDRIAEMKFGSELETYKMVCQQEYAERILTSER
jgi:hypothetical protein